MRALVLVGGQGTRLRPLTNDVPKQMLPVVGRPMIARVLEWLARASIEEAILSLGYIPDAFMSAFPAGEWAGVKLSYVVEPEPLDTAGAIRFAAHEAGADDERILVVNGDVLTDLDIVELVAAHEAHGGCATIALTPVEDPSAYGVVPTEPDGAVQEFIEKPPAGTAPTNHVNAGTYVIDPEAIAAIPADRRSSIEREVFPLLVEKRQLFAMPSDAYWIDTGTPLSYIRAQVDVVTGVRRGMELDGVVIDGGCYLGDGAAAHGTVGSSFLGAGARIEDGAVVECSVVDAGVTVEAGAVVRDAILLPGAVVRAGASVTRGIVGWDAVVSADATVTNGAIVGRDTVLEVGSVVDGAVPSV